MENSLYDYLEEENIRLVETRIPSDKVRGLYFDGTIVLDDRIVTEAERTCILAEEIGHYETAYTCALSTKSLHNAKQEGAALRWACLELIPLHSFIDCFNNGLRNRYECAEYLGVTENFFEKCVKLYNLIYGPFVAYDDYYIYFEPLGIMRAL